MKILFFDTETTGLVDDFNPIEKQPYMVQFGAIFGEYPIEEKAIFAAYNYSDGSFRFVPGTYTEESIDLLFKPGTPIPEKLTSIHGISNEMVADKPGFDSFAKYFVGLARQADYIVGHNVDFDRKVVFVELDRHYKTNSPEKAEFKKMFRDKMICTMQHTIDLCQIPGNFGKFKYPKLSELHVKLFDKDFDGAHNAASDIAATRDCFFELVKRGIIILK